MKIFSDETLMAFADDELDPATRAAVTEAMRNDPDIERQIARHRALRARLRLAYSAELEQPPPERLLAAARGRSGTQKATVTDLAAARAASVARRATPRPRWQPLAAMAASLLIGVAAGYGVFHRSDALVAGASGWVAGGALATALSGRLGGDSASGTAVRLGLSFVAKSGDYCRVFTLPSPGSPSGVACHRQDTWQIRVLAQEASPGPPAVSQGDSAQDTYRTASSPLPPVVLESIQSQIEGEPLDRDGEIKARRQDWRPDAR